MRSCATYPFRLDVNGRLLPPLGEAPFLSAHALTALGQRAFYLTHPRPQLEAALSVHGWTAAALPYGKGLLNTVTREVWFIDVVYAMLLLYAPNHRWRCLSRGSPADADARSWASLPDDDLSLMVRALGLHKAMR